jgi:hypothetical protein
MGRKNLTEDLILMRWAHLDLSSHTRFVTIRDVTHLEPLERREQVEKTQ